MRVKEESEKGSLKLNIKKTKIMASGPITSWQIKGKKVEAVTDFIFLGSKNHCRWWLQPVPWKERKAYDKHREHIKKQRNHFAKVHIVKAMVFSVVMYGCESRTIKKADAFKLWCWRRLLRVPWTARRSNQSILKEINPEYSLEGRMRRLQHFGYLKWKADPL